MLVGITSNSNFSNPFIQKILKITLFRYVAKEEPINGPTIGGLRACDGRVDPIALEDPSLIRCY